MDQSYWIIVIFWLVYFIIHSGLAASSVKIFMQAELGMGGKRYRMVYAIISTIPLIIFLIWLGKTPQSYLTPTQTWMQFTGLLVTSAAVILFKRSFARYSLKEFLGLREEKSDILIKDGVQAWIRHPLYSATLMLLLGLCLYMPTVENLISTVCIYIYIPIGIYFEEKKLINQFGEQYLKYREEVPALFPNIKF